MKIMLGVDKLYSMNDMMVEWAYGNCYLNNNDFSEIIVFYKGKLNIVIKVRKDNLEEVDKILSIYGFELEKSPVIIDTFNKFREWLTENELVYNGALTEILKVL